MKRDDLQFLACGIVLLSAASNLNAADQAPLTLETIFASDEFSNDSLHNVQWNADGSSFYFSETDPESGSVAITLRLADDAVESLRRKWGGMPDAQRGLA